MSNHNGNANKMVREDVSNEQVTAEATPDGELRRQILSSCVAKNEREWWASRTIEKLEFELNAANERIQRLEEWKESALSVEREWNANAIATMLGGQPGESQRKVVQREVPKLLARIKRLEAVVNDPESLWTNWLRGDVKLPVGIGDVRQYQDHIKRLEEAGDAFTNYFKPEYIDLRFETLVENWRKAKEAKP